jgi:hypothetical protein
VEKLAALAAADMISLQHSGAALRRCCAMHVSGTSDGPNEGGACCITFLSILWPSYFAGLPCVSVCVDAASTGVLHGERVFLSAICAEYPALCRLLSHAAFHVQSLIKLLPTGYCAKDINHRSAMWVWLLMLCDAAYHIQWLHPGLLGLPIVVHSVSCA